MYLFQNLKTDNEKHRTIILSRLMNFDPNNKLYGIFENSCINDDSSIVRTTAATGLIYCKGYIKNPFNMMELVQSMRLNKVLTDDIYEKRIKNINDFKIDIIK